MTEAEFLSQIVDLAQKLGWLVCHFRPAQTGKGWRTAVQGDGVGWPDLVLCRNNRLIFAECKIGKKKPSPRQELWLRALAETGAETYVFRDGVGWLAEVQLLLERTVDPMRARNG